MGMGVGNKDIGRELESDFFEDTKILCVSSCYFKTRPLILKIKGVHLSCKMYTCSRSSTHSVSHHKPSVMCDHQTTDESPTFLSHLETELPWISGHLISEIPCVSLSLHTESFCTLLHSLSPFFPLFFC